MGAQFPILIACRDRVESLGRLVTWLERAGQENIFLVDNDSAFEPLLEYYETTPHTVVRLGKNVGPQDFWSAGVVSSLARGQPYIVTDPDVVPTEDCPLDALDHFSELLQCHRDYVKVGFGLKIDDLPAHYRHRDAVRVWEAQFWEKEVAPGVFEANIDTTFALYRSHVDRFTLGPALRTGAPYLTRHEPWYSDVSKESPESRFYRKRYLRERSTLPGIKTTWNHRRLPHWLKIRLGDAKPRSWRIWARAARYVRNGFRRSGYTDL
jgi:hypothetical protein